MLNKKDLKEIESVIQNSLHEFFEKLLLPYFEHNEKVHDDLAKRHDKHDEDFDKVFRKLERNEDQHDEIFQDLDKIDKRLDKHDRRIEKLEAITLP